MLSFSGCTSFAWQNSETNWLTGNVAFPPYSASLWTRLPLATLSLSPLFHFQFLWKVWKGEFQSGGDVRTMERRRQRGPPLSSTSPLRLPLQLAATYRWFEKITPRMSTKSESKLMALVEITDTRSMIMTLIEIIQFKMTAALTLARLFCNWRARTLSAELNIHQVYHRVRFGSECSEPKRSVAKWMKETWLLNSVP